MSTTEPQLLCPIPQAAVRLSRSVRFIYEEIAKGELEAVKSGKSTLVVVASMDKYVEKLPRAKIKPITRKPKI
jgi:excisionase family DNA binding protein